MSEDLPPMSEFSSIRPCREEVMAVVRFICDCLKAEGLDYTCEQSDDDNPNWWSFIVEDKSGYINMGLISWLEDEDQVGYAAFKPDVANHDQSEGVSEDESLCWWRPQTARMFVSFLTGDVRELVRQDREAQWKEAA